MKKLADWVFSFFCRTKYYEDIRGDLEELRTRRLQHLSKLEADFKYLLAVCVLLRPGLIKRVTLIEIFKYFYMIPHYAKSAWRSFVRYKTYSAINVFGLSLGIASALLIYSFIQYQLSFDKHYEQKENIYRITQHYKFGNRQGSGITGSGLLAPLMAEEIPEVQLAGRSHYFGQAVIQVGTDKFIQNGVYYADPQLTSILEYEYLQGDGQTALSNPNSIVLSEKVAKKIFSDVNQILGQVLLINQVPMQVNGIIRDVPQNNHFSPSVLVSTSTMGEFSWDRVGHVSYVLLNQNSQPGLVNSKLNDMVVNNKLNNPEKDQYISFELFPVTAIHLSSDPNQEGSGNMSTIYTFILIAVFILLIASINYMNLATARASKRAKEIGIRKVIGAVRRQLSFQFLAEAIFLCMVSVSLGSLMAALLQTPFNQLADIPKDVHLINLKICLKLLGLGVFIGFLSGIYPAIVLSSFKPVAAIKGIRAHVGSKNLRRTLVAFQFTASIILIMTTMVVYNQLEFIQNKDLGYNKDAVYAIRLGDKKTSDVLKDQLLQHEKIRSVASTNVMPATGDSGATFKIQHENGETSKDIVSMASIDNDYLELMEMNLLNGEYGWNEPIGKQMTVESGDEEITFTIAGLVRDFNMLSLYEPVKPFAFFRLPLFEWGSKYLFVKIQPDEIRETLAFIQDKVEELEPEHLFNGRFLDEHLENIYWREKKQAKIFFGFAGLAIIIACLGLFGLTAYTLERRTKEISIRKILGAKFGDIIRLISMEFLVIILIAGFIATPIANYCIRDWLNKFSYHVNLGLATIFLSALIALSIALLTIGLLTIRTTRSNPVDILQYE